MASFTGGIDSLAVRSIFPKAKQVVGADPSVFGAYTFLADVLAVGMGRISCRCR